MKPILFLDVDGPLNPWKAKATQRPIGYKTVRARPAGSEWENPWARPLRVWLNPVHGEKLLNLPYDLVWATTWMGEANVWISPHIGLPELPVVEFQKPVLMRGRLHWKTEQLVSYADGRPFVWVDDECTNHDSGYFARYNPNGMIYRVDPAIGLEDDDFDALAEMAEELM